MMKKSKIDYDTAKELLARGRVQGYCLQSELVELMEGALSDSNARGIRYMIAYYGVHGEDGLTLESIGTQIAGGLTRERVRQIIDNGLLHLKRLESAKDLKPYEKTLTKFNALLSTHSATFIKLDDFLEDDYFTGFKGDSKGFIAFLNDAGIRQVVYRGTHYIYPAHIDRKSAIINIQVDNKKVRRAKTVEKMQGMSKTVTYVPPSIREALLDYSNLHNIALNRLYENILTDFIDSGEHVSTEDFSKTQSWRARQGKADWNQVGIYISKSVFDDVKVAAQKVQPLAVSNMSFICQAFIWFSERQSSTHLSVRAEKNECKELA